MLKSFSNISWKEVEFCHIRYWMNKFDANKVKGWM